MSFSHSHELRVVSDREVQSTHKPPDTPAGCSCGRSVRCGSPSPGPGPLLPAAPLTSFARALGPPCPDSRLPERTAFGGGPGCSRPVHRPRTTSPTAPRRSASSHYPRPTATPRFDSRAELRHPCAPHPTSCLHRLKWPRLPDRNWLRIVDRYQMVRSPGYWRGCHVPRRRPPAPLAASSRDDNG